MKDHIDADYLQDLPMGMGAVMPVNSTFVQLQFANHDAALYGFEMSGATTIWSNAAFGKAKLSASVAYTHGVNDDTGDPLYRIAPLSGRLALEHPLGPWENRLEIELSSQKDLINATRHEATTGAYALVNI